MSEVQLIEQTDTSKREIEKGASQPSSKPNKVTKAYPAEVEGGIYIRKRQYDLYGDVNETNDGPIPPDSNRNTPKIADMSGAALNAKIHSLKLEPFEEDGPHVESGEERLKPSTIFRPTPKGSDMNKN